jgi:hypoxia-inducible factor (prolyl hydroxylase)
MEIEFPWAPTPPSQRRAAVQAFVDGEALCDSGDTQAGVLKLKAASRLAWELEQETWPDWASELHAELTGEGGCVPPPPTLISRCTAPWQPEISSLSALATCSEDYRPPSWWRSEAATRALASTLASHSIAIVDRFAGVEALAAVRAEAARAAARGELQPAKIRIGPGYGHGLVDAAPARRGDHILWADEAQPQWDALRGVAALVDTLVCGLRATCPPLASIAARMAPMLATYPRGAAFARHSDNHCVAGKGPHCDTRVLTAVYYMSDDDWDGERDGGCLRIFRPSLAGSAAGETAVHRAAGSAEALMDVAPMGDRLVLFLSDLRCPHEVLPVRRAGGSRTACTLWYCHALGEEAAAAAARLPSASVTLPPLATGGVPGGASRGSP